MFILQIGGWFIFSCILMSFIEHQVHRKLMHRTSFLSAHTAFVSWQGAAVFVAAMIFHHWAWNQIHLEMHKPEQRVFSTWPVYKFLARYHCLHHRHLDRNFNVVFPLADY